MAEGKYTIEYFGSWSRDCLKVLQFMVKRWPKKKMFFTDELGQVLNMNGRALGGVLGGFSKAESRLVLKMGMSTSAWSGERFPRPQQLWGLNPSLTPGDIQQISESLKAFSLESN